MILKSLLKKCMQSAFRRLTKLSPQTPGRGEGCKREPTHAWAGGSGRLSYLRGDGEVAGRCAPAATQPPVRKTMQTLNPKEIGEGVTGMDTQQRQDRARSTT